MDGKKNVEFKTFRLKTKKEWKGIKREKKYQQGVIEPKRKIQKKKEGKKGDPPPKKKQCRILRKKTGKRGKSWKAIENRSQNRNIEYEIKTTGFDKVQITRRSNLSGS